MRKRASDILRPVNSIRPGESAQPALHASRRWTLSLSLSLSFSLSRGYISRLKCVDDLTERRSHQCSTITPKDVRCSQISFSLVASRGQEQYRSHVYSPSFEWFDHSNVVLERGPLKDVFETKLRLSISRRRRRCARPLALEELAQLTVTTTTKG